MIIGLDVGGTHTDAVLLTADGIASRIKIITDQQDLTGTIADCLERVLAGHDPACIRRVQLSTTVSTNTIVEERLEPVGMILQPGPGLDPSWLACGRETVIIGGAVDHRGSETAPLDPGEITEATRRFREAGVRAYGIAAKFGIRNPAVETTIAALLASESAEPLPITLGHTLSGRLHFPRRVFSTWLNAAVGANFSRFAAAVRATLGRLAPMAEVFLLKADGGTIDLATAASFPVQTILSGPAASVMGALALTPGLEGSAEDAVLLDIGGTSTDIAFLERGRPVSFRNGLEIAGYPTLVRGLYNRSIGLGGDSRVAVIEGGIAIGPRREGPAMALGGPVPTPGDALIVLGKAQFGDPALARNAMAQIGSALGIEPVEAAKRVVERFAQRVKAEIASGIEELAARPVDTIRAVLADRRLRPRRASLIGGPAQALGPVLAESLGIPVHVPLDAGYANSVGAALSRPTAEITLLADTGMGMLTVPELGRRAVIDQRFTLDDAKREALAALDEFLRRRPLAGCDAGAGTTATAGEILEATQFNQVEGFRTRGRQFRITAHLPPGRMAGEGLQPSEPFVP